MTALGLGDVAAFPFIDPPDGRSIRDGVLLLEELGALVPDVPADQRRLTVTGKRLARLPLDPRLGRMVLEAERNGCVREVMVVAAALSIQDPRERPAEARQAADEAHRRFETDASDFLALVRLWDHLREQQRALSSNQFRRLCRSEFLNYLRVREWQDLFSQLRQAAGAVGIRPGTADGHPDRIHQSLLAGLLSHIGMRDGTSREYRGGRGARFVVGRESAAAKKAPRWVMAAGLVETNRLWARTVAPIQPEWAERVGAHLVSRSYGDPVWDATRGAAVTVERVTLFGLPIVTGRQVGYDRVDVHVAREMFIRHALVYGEWTSHHRFVVENRGVLEELKGLAERTRRAQLVDEAAVFAFYERRVPAGIVSARHFDRWWKDESRVHPTLLTLTFEALLEGTGASLDPRDFPGVWRQDDLELEVTYRFEPGQPGDGVTIHVPLPVLNRVRDEGFDWQVAGFRAELVSALVRTLPKHLRRAVAPLAEAADEVFRRADPSAGPLRAEVARVLSDIGGVTVRAADLDLARVPDHLRITFSVDDEHGRPIATGTELAALRTLLARPLRAAVAAAAPSIERRGITRWDFGTLPRTVESERGGLTVLGYPALLDDDDSVSIRVFTNADVQARAMRTGLRRLLLLAVAVPARTLERQLSSSLRLSLAASGFTATALAAESVRAVADAFVAEHGADIWTPDAFEHLVELATPRLAAQAAQALRTAAEIVAASTIVRAALDRLVTPALRPSVDDMRAQLDRLVSPGFVTASGANRLDDVLRYVRGVDRRAAKVTENPRRDQQRMAEVVALEDRYRAVLARMGRGPLPQAVVDAGWLLEELRVSIFAQSLGTPRPVSPQRMVRTLAALV
jgi:ATP-dependent helicase HrpA